MRKGLKLKLKRVEKDLSQKEIAKELGISREVISKYEIGRSIPKPEVMKKLADYFEMTVDELFFKE